MNHLPEKVSLHITGVQPYESLHSVELRIGPSASWSIDKPVYKVQWGIKHRNGNRVLGTLIEDIRYDNSENLFALVLGALEALKRDGRFAHNTWDAISTSSDDDHQPHDPQRLRELE